MQTPSSGPMLAASACRVTRGWIAAVVLVMLLVADALYRAKTTRSTIRVRPLFERRSERLLVHPARTS